MKRRNDDVFPSGGGEKKQQQQKQQQQQGEYFVISVVDEKGVVVGTGAVIVERKFIHGLGLVAHIEDIVVRKDQQGKKLGLRIIEALDHVAKEVGCYKVSFSSFPFPSLLYIARLPCASSAPDFSV